MRNLFKPLLWQLYKWYLKKPRWYTYDGLKVRILPTVFHPGLLISTKFLLKYLKTFNFRNKKILELGAGSGLISLWINRTGGNCLASDINPAAVESIRISNSENGLNVKTVLSDVFESIEKQQFDFIIINPPYYEGEYVTMRQAAFYCGEKYMFFQKLFSDLKEYYEGGTAIMILNEFTNIKEIKKYAMKSNWDLKMVLSDKIKGESQFIFHIIPLDSQ